MKDFVLLNYYIIYDMGHFESPRTDVVNLISSLSKNCNFLPGFSVR